MDIHSPTQPRHLRITQTMVEDFLIDPVLGVSVIFKVKLDAYQASRLRYYWWVPNVIDSSGFGTGKSLTFWLFMQLRCIILGNQWVCAYYQTFEAGKKIFWPYFTQFNARKAPLFHAQLGKMTMEGEVDGKDKNNTRGPACFYQHYRNESLCMMPAPNWFQSATGQAGLTINVAGIDEWTKVETMTKKSDQRTVNDRGEVVGGINQQILGRVRRESFNREHPIWGNHRLFLATAESMNHPAYARVRVYKKEIEKGNPNYALISYSFKDVSNLPSHTGKPFRDQIIDWTTIKDMQANFTRAHFLRECLGVWARETTGWYSEESLNRCVSLGISCGTEPETQRAAESHALQRPGVGPRYRYFMGIDPAPAQGKKSDDGALAVLRVQPKPGLNAEPGSNPGDWQAEFVWAYRMRGKSIDQWSGFIHQKHQQFNLDGILMDPNGGGQWLYPKMASARQTLNGIETECVPIRRLDDPTSGNAFILLNLFERKDSGISRLWQFLKGDDNLYEAMHVVFQEVVEQAAAAFPLPFNERPRSTTEDWTEEKKWALKDLDAAREQLLNIQVAKRDDGEWILTRNHAKTFTAVGKKDLAYACIFAYVRFLLWLKLCEWEFGGQSSGDSGVYIMRT